MCIIQIGEAFGAHAFGTALVVFFDSTGFRYKGCDGTHSDHYCNAEVDYQSGPERMRSKVSADLIFAQASVMCDLNITSGAS